MFETEKQFLKWLLSIIKTVHTFTDFLTEINANSHVGTDSITKSNGKFMAVSTQIPNYNYPYVYSFFFENENDIKKDTEQITHLMNDIDMLS